MLLFDWLAKVTNDAILQSAGPSDVAEGERSEQADDRACGLGARQEAGVGRFPTLFHDDRMRNAGLFCIACASSARPLGRARGSSISIKDPILRAVPDDPGSSRPTILNLPKRRGGKRPTSRSLSSF